MKVMKCMKEERDSQPNYRRGAEDDNCLRRTRKELMFSQAV